MVVGSNPAGGADFVPFSLSLMQLCIEREGIFQAAWSPLTIIGREVEIGGSAQDFFVTGLIGRSFMASQIHKVKFASWQHCYPNIPKFAIGRPLALIMKPPAWQKISKYYDQHRINIY
jgi:hypothetical protein